MPPAGVYALSIFGGIAIFEPDNIDRFKDNCDFVAAWHNGEEYFGFHKYMLHYTKSGRCYIYKGKLKIYLDEVIRTA